jgi:hypothetical protein
VEARWRVCRASGRTREAGVRGERGIHQLHSPEWRVQRTALGFRGREASADFSRHPVRLRRAVFRAQDDRICPVIAHACGNRLLEITGFRWKKNGFSENRSRRESFGSAHRRFSRPRLPSSPSEFVRGTRVDRARCVTIHIPLRHDTRYAIRDTRYVCFDASRSVSRQSLRPRFNPVLTRTARATPSAPSPPPRAAAFRARSS